MCDPVFLETRVANPAGVDPDLTLDTSPDPAIKKPGSGYDLAKINPYPIPTEKKNLNLTDFLYCQYI